jgi:hypothetical protein
MFERVRVILKDLGLPDDPAAKLVFAGDSHCVSHRLFLYIRSKAP